MPSPARTSPGAHALAFIGYSALTAGWFWWLLPVITQAYPHDPGDPALNAWVLWWNSRLLPFTAAWWNAPSFFPLANVAAFTEVLVGLSPLASPVVWATGNPVLAYNLVFLSSFPLAAFGAYLLGLELTGDRRAAFIAGLAFGFAPYRVAQVPHLQVLASYWMPIALFALHRYLRVRRAGWLLLFGLAWLLQALSNGYYLLFFTVLLAAWAGWFLARRGEWRALARVGAVWLAVALAVVPVLLRYRQVQQAFGMERGLGEIRLYSGDAASFLTASPSLAAWGWLRAFPLPEGELFPGLTIVAVVVLGVIVSVGRGHRGQDGQEDRPAFDSARAKGAGRIARAVLGAGAAVAALVTASFYVFGAWSIRLGSLKLLSVGQGHKPATWFMLFGAAFVATHPRFVQAFRRRSPFAFYVAAAALIALASLGPEPRLLGEEILYKPPYALLLELPGFNGLRVPTRFWMLGVLCLSAAGAIAFARIAPRRRRLGTMAALLVALGVAVDGWPVRMPSAGAARMPSCGPDPSAGAVAFLQLPIGEIPRDIAAMHRALRRGLPAFNGYSGYTPPHYVPLVEGLAELDRWLLAELAAAGPLEVAIDLEADADGANAAFVAAHPGASELAGCGGDMRIFTLPRAARDPGPSGGSRAELPVAGLYSDVAPQALPSLTDGNLVSRWEVTQTADASLVVDLGATRRLEAVVLALGPYERDFPRRLRIEHSIDGISWTTARDGPTYREAFRAGLGDPRGLPLRFGLGGVDARYLRLFQHGRDPVWSWSIAELAVLAVPDATP